MLIQYSKLILLVDLKEMKKCFPSLKKQKKQLLIFHKILQASYKMETQKIILLNNSNNEESEFATKKTGMS